MLFPKALPAQRHAVAWDHQPSNMWRIEEESLDHSDTPTPAQSLPGSDQLVNLPVYLRVQMLHLLCCLMQPETYWVVNMSQNMLDVIVKCNQHETSARLQGVSTVPRLLHALAGIRSTPAGIASSCLCKWSLKTEPAPSQDAGLPTSCPCGCFHIRSKSCIMNCCTYTALTVRRKYATAQNER